MQLKLASAQSALISLANFLTIFVLLGRFDASLTDAYFTFINIAYGVAAVFSAYVSFGLLKDLSDRNVFSGLGFFLLGALFTVISLLLGSIFGLDFEISILVAIVTGCSCLRSFLSNFIISKGFLNQSLSIQLMGSVGTLFWISYMDTDPRFCVAVNIGIQLFFLARTFGHVDGAMQFSSELDTSAYRKFFPTVALVSVYQLVFWIDSFYSPHLDEGALSELSLIHRVFGFVVTTTITPLAIKFVLQDSRVPIAVVLSLVITAPLISIIGFILIDGVWVQLVAVGAEIWQGSESWLARADVKSYFLFLPGFVVMALSSISFRHFLSGTEAMLNRALPVILLNLAVWGVTYSGLIGWALNYGSVELETIGVAFSLAWYIYFFISGFFIERWFDDRLGRTHF